MSPTAALAWNASNLPFSPTNWGHTGKAGLVNFGEADFHIPSLLSLAGQTSLCSC